MGSWSGSVVGSSEPGGVSEGVSAAQVPPEVWQRLLWAYQGWLRRHEGLARVLLRLTRVCQRITFVLMVAALAVVPGLLAALVPAAAMLGCLMVMALLGRTRTVSWRAMSLMFSVGVPWAVVVALLTRVVAGWAGVEVSDDGAGIALAAFIEEPGKLAPLVVAAGLIMFLPTSRLVSAVQDAINGFPITSAGRFVSTGMSFLGLVIGIASAVSALAVFGGPTIDIEQTKFVPSDTATFSVFMLAATASFAVAAHTKVAKIGWLLMITTAGLITYYGYWVLTGESTGRSNTALAAFVIGLFSTYMAYRLHAPQAIFSIPALTFLLPGLEFFRGMYLLTVDTNVVFGLSSMVTAVSVVIAMAAGTAAGNYLMQYLLQRFAPTTGETD